MACVALSETVKLKAFIRNLFFAFLALAFALPSMAGEVKTISISGMEDYLAEGVDARGIAIFDSRSRAKYDAGHLPWAKSLPYDEMEENLDKLPADKDKPLIFYCDGQKCDFSGKAAKLAISEGYSDVSIFVEGLPGWKKAGNSPWVEKSFVDEIIEDPTRLALILDSRPPVKYMEGTIPGALNLSHNFIDNRKGLLPADLEADLVFFCGGPKCDLSRKSADAARQLGYKNTYLYAEGWPGWQEKSASAFMLMNPRLTVAAMAHEAAPKFKGEIRKKEFQAILDKRPADVLLVDVRPANEFASAHIEGAINLVEDDFVENEEKLKGYTSVILYCNAGNLASAAYYELEYLNINGGYYNGVVIFRPDGSVVLE